MTEPAKKIEEVLDEEGNPIVEPDPNLEPVEGEPPEVELDEEGNPIEAEIPLFMQDGDDDGLAPVPAKTHIKKTMKLRGKLEVADDEIERLTRENEQLKSGTIAAPPEKLIRPKRDDFDTDDEYDDAYDTYRDQKADARSQGVQSQTNAMKSQEARESSVAGHYERAEKLVTEFSITPDAYTKADTEVRNAVEAIMPKRGDGVVDHLISEMGEGSEKVIYFLGVNKAARRELQAALLEDPQGIKAAIYLGKLSSKMDGTKSKTSRAAKPAAKLKGGESAPANEKAFIKKYKDAHKAKDTQKAFDTKQAAKKAGIDTSNW